MKFFDREDKIEKLRNIQAESMNESKFTVITGRRRIGKTELVKQAYAKTPFAYLFVSDKSEKELVEGFVNEFNSVIPSAISSDIHTLEGFFTEVFKVAKSQNITVFIDEFQDFRKVKPSFFSILQGIWDRDHDKARLNLIVCGSINSIMNKIFMNRKQPLFGRQTSFMRIEPFSIPVLKKILAFHKENYKAEDLLALWTFTGGIAKYVALLMDAGATTLEKMVKVIVEEDSFFINEGRFLLSDEFGKGFSTYFSILSAISKGMTTRNEIEQFVGRQIGGHISRLEEDYHMIAKIRPFGAKNARLTRYQISDPFYRFWFRFIFKYDYMIQINAFAKLRSILLRDYPIFSGYSLEQYFKSQLAESGEFSRIGGWWDRKGENEIDIIAEDEVDGKMLVAEVKRDESRGDLDALKEKFAAFSHSYKVGGRKSIEFKILSMAEM